MMNKEIMIAFLHIYKLLHGNVFLSSSLISIYLSDIVIDVLQSKAFFLNCLFKFTIILFSALIAVIIPLCRCEVR